MGQKINPIGFRIAVTKDWRSRWFARKADFGDLLHEDLKIRAYVKKQLYQAAVARIQIERFANRIRITVHCARPGLVFRRGRRSEIDGLKQVLFNMTNGKEIYVDVVEIKRPELNAQLVAESIASQLERRIGYRRAMKKSIQSTMDMGADGIKIRCGGRLGGAELSRSEEYKEGRTPLHTLRADVQYGFAQAFTPAGICGVKVWLCLPEMTEEERNALNAKTRKAPKGAARKPRGKRVQK